MHTDASGYALGVIIAQEHDNGMHPVAFHLRSLLPAEKNYDVHDKELAGIVFGFKCSCALFLGATVNTLSVYLPTTRISNISVNHRK